jgi:hypothetical protein
MSQLARWWWIIPICAAAVALAAVSLSSHKLTDPRAVARVHAQDTTVSYQFSGEPQPFTAARTVNDLSETDFIDPQTAQAAARKLGGGITGDQMVSHLGFAALSGTDLQLSYSDGSAPSVTEQRLKAYTDTLVTQRIANEKRALDQAASTLAANNGDQTAITRLRTAASALDQQIHTVGSITVTSGRTIPKPVLLVGGALAGAILGVLIALAVAGADRRIRTIDDLRAAGVRTIEVDSDKPESVEALRALAEVAGVDAAGGVVAVMTPRGDHSTPLARALATAFARSGRPASLVADDGAMRSDHGGWESSGAGRGLLASLPRLRTALGHNRTGEVTVVDAPALLERSGNLVASAVAEVTVLSLRRGHSTWSELESSLELLGDAAAQGRVRVVLDRGRGRATLELPQVPVAAGERAQERAPA